MTDDSKPPIFKKGDAVAYLTRAFGEKTGLWVTAFVEGVAKDGLVHLRAVPGNVAISVKAEILTKVKTVWWDSHKIIEEKETADA